MSALLPGVRTVVTQSVPARDEHGRLVLYVHPDTVRALEQRLRGQPRKRRSRPLPHVGDVG